MIDLVKPKKNTTKKHLLYLHCIIHLNNSKKKIKSSVTHSQKGIKKQKSLSL